MFAIVAIVTVDDNIAIVAVVTVIAIVVMPYS